MAKAHDALGSTRMTKDVVKTAIADGRYYWKLLYDLKNTGTLKETRKYKKKHVVKGKEFLSQKFNVDTGFTYDNKVSASVEFEGLGEGSANVEYNFHIDTAYELVKTSQTYTDIEEEEEDTREFSTDQNGNLTIYQLCYSTDAVDLETNIFASQPRPDAIVKLKFSLVRQIVGLEDILYLFSHTFPERSNTVEWEKLRSSIVKSSSLGGLTQFHAFVEALNDFVPQRSNVREWVAIRETCNEIEGAWSVEHRKELLFKKLLYRFSVTRPESENTREWAAIRDLSDKILAGMKEINWGRS
jgi:hypothetical protein